MSLNASLALVQKAGQDQMTAEDFIDCIKQSLPAAWNILENISDQLKSNMDIVWASYAPLHMDDSNRGQILRLMASSSMRSAVENYFGLKFEFQNCHYTAGFKPQAVGKKEYVEFISSKAQILAQRKELRDC